MLKLRKVTLDNQSLFPLQSPDHLTMDLFPQQVNSSTSSTHQDLPNYRMYKNMRREAQRAQVTMIYEGKVFVFSDLSPEKAEEILLLAEQDETLPQIYTQFSHRPAPITPRNNPNQWSLMTNINQGTNFDVSMSHMTCELPIARRNSLHRFLEKRQDRCGGRGPYHYNSGDRLVAVSQPRFESKWWLGLTPQPPQ